MQERLPQDATVESILARLTKPEDYVRAVLSNMHACYRVNGNAQVRIGVTGEGKSPYYKITFVAAGGSEQLYGAFDGTRPFRNVFIHDDTWSLIASDLSQIRNILGKIRGFGSEKA